MKMGIKNILIKQNTIYMVITIILTVFLQLAITAEAEDQRLQGEMFTSPSFINQMPQEWLKKPIKYQKWARDANIAISLDQHFYHLFLPLIHMFEEENNLKIEVKEGTCGISSGLLARKAIDIGGFCCSPGYTDRLPQLLYHTVGATSLTILVHPDNPINNITFEQAQKIFQGKITNWSQLRTAKGQPGPNKDIKVVARLHCKLRPGHWRLLLDIEDLFSPLLHEVGSIPEVIEQVANNRWAIGGFESAYMAYYTYPQETIPKALTIDGYSPDNPQHIISGKYPLHFIFNITTWEGKRVENPHAKKLVEYLLQKVKLIDKKYNIIPVSRLRESGWKFKGNELIGTP